MEKLRPHEYNINNTKVYKNKSVSENYCTPWINIWRYEDFKTNKLTSKWLDLALNDPKRLIYCKTKWATRLNVGVRDIIKDWSTSVIFLSLICETIVLKEFHYIFGWQQWKMFWKSKKIKCVINSKIAVEIIALRVIVY